MHEDDVMRRNAKRYEWLRENFKFANDSAYEIWFDSKLSKPDLPSDLDMSIDRMMYDQRNG